MHDVVQQSQLPAHGVFGSETERPVYFSVVTQRREKRHTLPALADQAAGFFAEAFR